MTSVARRDVENLPVKGRSCQPGTTGRPRHDWSMRLLGGNMADLTGPEACEALANESR